MIPPGGDPNHWLFITGGTIFGFAILAALIRLLIGRTLADRVVALDLIGFQVVGLLGLFSIVTPRQQLLAISLVAGIILFLGTAAFAIYLGRRESP